MSLNTLPPELRNVILEAESLAPRIRRFIQGNKSQLEDPAYRRSPSNRLTHWYCPTINQCDNLMASRHRVLTSLYWPLMYQLLMTRHPILDYFHGEAYDLANVDFILVALGDLETEDDEEQEKEVVGRMIDVLVGGMYDSTFNGPIWNDWNENEDEYRESLAQLLLETPGFATLLRAFVLLYNANVEIEYPSEACRISRPSWNWNPPSLLLT